MSIFTPEQIREAVRGANADQRAMMNTPTHDCENNIESNMTAPHCRVCAPTHNEVEKKWKEEFGYTFNTLCEEVQKELVYGHDITVNARYKLFNKLIPIINALLLAQKKQIEERVEKAEEELYCDNHEGCEDCCGEHCCTRAFRAVKEVLSE